MQDSAIGFFNIHNYITQSPPNEVASGRKHTLNSEEPL